MTSDSELLRQYAEAGVQDAFTELVRRHIGLVYSAALRQLNGDAHLAADAAQLVFTDLARKAGAVAEYRVLAGWLYTSTRYATAKLVRTERRRQHREVEAHRMEMDAQDSETALDWTALRPVLDEVLTSLKTEDREVILLRFFEGREYAAIGERLHLDRNTARMRVERALEKLRRKLERRGLVSTQAALALALGAHAVAAVPPGLALRVATQAMAAPLVGVGGWLAAGGISKAYLSAAGIVLGCGAVIWSLQGPTSYSRGDERVRVAHQERALPADLAAASVVQVSLEPLTTYPPVADSEPVRESATVDPGVRSAPVLSLAELTGPDDWAPSVLRQQRPIYPDTLRPRGIAGEVRVSVIIGPAGDVQDAQVLDSTHVAFEAPALTALRAWHFEPGRKSGQAVATAMVVPVHFPPELLAEVAGEAQAERPGR